MDHDELMKQLDDLLHPGDTLMVGTPADLGTMKSRPLTVRQVGLVR